MYSVNRARSIASIASVIGAALLGCKGDATSSPVVGTITVTTTSPAVLPTQTVHATAIVKSTTGETLTGRTVTWQSSATSIATVLASGADATVTAIAPGAATITATSEGVSGTASLTVNTPPDAMTDLTVGPTAPSLIGVGATQVITTTPVGAAGAAVTYANSSNNVAVATVSTTGENPTVTAVGAGTATISIAATATGPLRTPTTLTRTVLVTVTILPNALLAFTVSPATPTNIANFGSTQLITTSVTLAAGATVTYSNSSSNGSVATVTLSDANPVITAVSPGTTTVTLTATGQGAGLTTNMISRSITITVSAVSTVQLVLANTSLAVGQTSATTLVLKDAAGTTLNARHVSTWSTDNGDVVRVNALTGVITALATGTATIGATIEGKTGSATVAVCVAGITPPTGNTPSRFAAASLGNDATGTGTCAQPYKTITKATTGVSSGTQILVSPGTYDAALGETFPIVLPANVALLGDEPNKGQGTVHTRIAGGGVVADVGGNCLGLGSAVYSTGANTTLAGFEVANSTLGSTQMTLLMRYDNLTVRNNALTGNTTGSAALYMCNGSRSHNITGNHIYDNSSIALGFIGGGANSLVENNVITNNRYGAEFDSEGGDLGGGARGSVGNNVISCNIQGDIWTNVFMIIAAANNWWDHVPLSATDFQPNGSAAILTTTGARVAPTPCL